MLFPPKPGLVVSLLVEIVPHLHLHLYEGVPNPQSGPPRPSFIHTYMHSHRTQEWCRVARRACYMYTRAPCNCV